MEHHHAAERPAYSYLRIRNKIFPWGGDCGLFEYGKCQEE
jgi:cytochrome c oxidase subunit 6a